MQINELEHFSQQQQQRAALQELQQQLTQAQADYDTQTEHDRHRRRTTEDHATKYEQQLVEQRRELQDLDRFLLMHIAQLCIVCVLVEFGTRVPGTNSVYSGFVFAYIIDVVHKPPKRNRCRGHSLNLSAQQSRDGGGADD